MIGRAGDWWLPTALRFVFLETPMVLSATLIGFLSFGAFGGLIGLFLGLHAYVPTAWAAVVEVGTPLAAVGSVIGFLVGLIGRWLVGPRPDVRPVDDDFAGTPQRW